MRALVVAVCLLVMTAAMGCGAATRNGAGFGKGVRAGDTQRGKASWYGPGFQGRKTANGERFDMNALTAAHRKLPFGSIVRVTNLANGRSVRVRINDRGPFGGGGRIIDLSKGAAKVLRMIDAGVVRVELTVISRPATVAPARGHVAMWPCGHVIKGRQAGRR